MDDTNSASWSGAKGNWCMTSNGSPGAMSRCPRLRSSAFVASMCCPPAPVRPGLGECGVQRPFGEIDAVDAGHQRIGHLVRSTAIGTALSSGPVPAKQGGAGRDAESFRLSMVAGIASLSALSSAPAGPFARRSR